MKRAKFKINGEPCDSYGQYPDQTETENRVRRTVTATDQTIFMWRIEGDNPLPCMREIDHNKITELTPYLETMFRQRYGCKAEITQRIEVVS